MAPEGSGSRSEGEQYLLVRAGATRYAVPTWAIRRVVQMPDLYRVPGAQPWLLGLGQYGGEPLAVVDLQGLEIATVGVGGGRGVMVVIAPGGELLIGRAADDAEYVTRLAGGPGGGQADSTIWTVDDDGVRRLDPSWCLARAEGPEEGTGSGDP